MTRRPTWLSAAAIGGAIALLAVSTGPVFAQDAAELPPDGGYTSYPNYGEGVDCDAGTFNGAPYTGLVVYFQRALAFGRVTGATPDGRRSGDVLEDSIGPWPGRDVSGPSAAMCSAAGIPQEQAEAQARDEVRHECGIAAKGPGLGDGLPLSAAEDLRDTGRLTGYAEGHLGVVGVGPEGGHDLGADR